MRSFNFKVKLIGEEKYLTYIMGEETELDEDVLDYCEENDLKELVKIIYEEDDDYDYLTYDVTGKHTIDDLLSKEMACENVLMILRNIANGLISLKEQAVKLNYILLNRQFMYIDELLNVSFICLPVESSGGLAAEFKGFVRQFLANIRYDVDEDLNYVGKLLTYINGDNFNLRGLVGLSEALMEEAGIGFEEVGGIEADGVEVMNSEEVEPEGEGIKDFMDSLADDADEPLPEIGDDEAEDDTEDAEAETADDEELDSILPAGMKLDDAEADEDAADEEMEDEETDDAEQQAEDTENPATDTEKVKETEQAEDEDEQAEDTVKPEAEKDVKAESSVAEPEQPAEEEKAEVKTEHKATEPGASEKKDIQAAATETADKVKPEKKKKKSDAEGTVKPEKKSEGKSEATGNTDNLKKPEAPRTVAKEANPEILKSRIKALAGNDSIGLKKKEEVFSSEQEMDAFLGSKPPVIKKNSVKVNRAAIIQNIAASEEETEAAVEVKEKEEQPVPVIEEISESINQEKKPKSNSILSKTVETVSKQQPATNILNNVVKAMPYLVRVNTDERIMLRKEVFKIGKANIGVDYTISGNGAISRQHAVIVRRDDVSYIKDNKSTNHTYVNDKMVEEGEEVILTHDSLIRLGDEEFVFKIR